MRYIAALLFIVAVSTPSIALEGDLMNAKYEDTKFSSVILWAVGFSEKDREEIERDTVPVFEKKGIRAIAMVDLVPAQGPEQDSVTADDIDAAIRANGAQTILQMTDGRMKSWPTSGQIDVGTMGAFSPQQVSSVNRPSNGNQRQLPTAMFRVRLLDADGKYLIWMDDIKVSGHRHVKANYLAEKAFRKASRYAIKDGLFEAEAH